MSPDPLPDGIVILDFGGQYCHLIARRVREMNVYSEILPSDASLEEVKALGGVMVIKGIILSGSPSSVNAENPLKLDERILDLGVPVLGLCYGHQLLASLHGGDVRKGSVREYGSRTAFIDRPEHILLGMQMEEPVWMSHGDTVYSLPSCFRVLAHTDSAPVAAFRHEEKPIYGLQWHPEVKHTIHGDKMLTNFVFKVCGSQPNWHPADAVEEGIKAVLAQVGKGKAVIALSGGVDSSVAAAIVGKALGKRIIAVHVDHGMMRLHESEQVKEAMEKAGVNVKVVDAKDRFLRRLRGVTDPETKRKIIGEEFIRVFEEEAERFGAKYLVQGTIYPDRIESGITRHADTIKTHHNVGGLPIHMDFKGVVEPLKDLYKDEVRALGEKLELPRELVWRQPFPGPGLAVRIVGEITEEKLEALRSADAIVTDEVEHSEIAGVPWQYFAVLTDTKSTGVKGDERAYGWTVAVRIVESVDAMTANFTRPPWDLLERISTRITNGIPEVTRVVYDITNKPPSTIEWE
ncbi:MAG: glutamine-hydrolyzing GMP synthase [Candidatus Bathyarchaeia archaeon]